MIRKPYSKPQLTKQQALASVTAVPSSKSTPE